MASIRDLKKDLNYIFSDIIEECYVWQLENTENADKAEPIIDGAIASFDSLIERINDKKVSAKKAHYKVILTDLESNVNDLMGEISKL